jgi:Arc/MetJ-type ribon-helix-helix transcriptional regulator
VKITIYLKEWLVDALDRSAREIGRSRSALVREAVEQWLARRSERAGWPTSVRDWQGVPDFPPFEAARVDRQRSY